MSAGTERRRFGILLHPSALPGGHGIGDLGPEARRFVDWLAAAGAEVWQVLPLGPPGGRLRDVPYASWSALAGDPRLISLEDLTEHGLLDSSALPRRAPEGWVRFDGLAERKLDCLAGLPAALRGHAWAEDFARFSAEAEWAKETARFSVAKRRYAGAPWWRWPQPERDRRPDALRALEADPGYELELARQFVFERQWAELKAYAARRNVSVLGDLAIYVMHDSADVWAHREGWKIDSQGRLLAQSGCPPDVFSAEGQLWGGPVYDWPRMAEDDYRWWRRRMERAFAHVDLVRLDHFRAFAAYWEIPPDARSAAAGRWVPGPGRHLFERLEARLGPLALCVEDLGIIDDDVHALREAIGAPSMRILHYGFGEGPDNPHLPHNVPPDAIVYPGNHDNDTSHGWWARLSPEAKSHAQHYLGRHGDDIAWDLNRAALACPAKLAVIQMQDVLSLGSEARVNDPVTYARREGMDKNWRWRLRPGEATGAHAERLRFLASLYGRVR